MELTNAPQVTTEPVVTDTAVTATAITEPAGKEPTIEKEESVTSPDWELAQNSGTIGALKQYLAACKGTCEHHCRGIKPAKDTTTASGLYSACPK